MPELILLLSSAAAGFLGSLLGLGGGIIVIPVLTLGFHVDIRAAIAASLISIVATSSGAAAGFLKDRLTNVRLAIFLEVATVVGAVVGFLIAGWVRASWLFLLFGFFLLFSAVMMLRRREETKATKNHPWSERLKFASSYPGDRGDTVAYLVEKVPFGWVVMLVAGVLSGLLGIGSGIFKVLAMDGAMKLPLKVSSATSNFMIGVTATASAAAHFVHGNVVPEIAAPVALGIIAGSWIGARFMVKMPTIWIRRIFVVVLAIVSVQMIMKGWGS